MQPIYFAYGSNLWYARLHQRCPSIERLGMGRLPRHRFSFNKPGGDGSGKAGIEAVDSDEFVLGVLYRMSASDKSALDRIEGRGHGYLDQEVTVHSEGGPVDCFTYYPTLYEQSMPPWDWYKRYVLEGARQNRFPESYIDMIEQVEAWPDPDHARRAANLLLLGVTN